MSSSVYLFVLRVTTWNRTRVRIQIEVGVGVVVESDIGIEFEIGFVVTFDEITNRTIIEVVVSSQKPLRVNNSSIVKLRHVHLIYVLIPLSNGNTSRFFNPNILFSK
ncbi:hypothetical protein L2E82_13921 [Cichorium intybus]|uniref:Uncharacterized protein n=1 Tax=Cichorium intybus TaxID=13427 RepID=A0ACB9EZB9_CICIN|nr:hypothetical protein L2E82_13921 [Cichorium intybus]